MQDNTHAYGFNADLPTKGEKNKGVPVYQAGPPTSYKWSYNSYK